MMWKTEDRLRAQDVDFLDGTEFLTAFDPPPVRAYKHPRDREGYYIADDSHNAVAGPVV